MKRIKFKQTLLPLEQRVKRQRKRMVLQKLKKGERIFIFSDGFPDQFGGKKAKKLKYKPFMHLLLDTIDDNMNNQRESLEDFFNEWSGPYDQIDDVCVIGVKV